MFTGVEFAMQGVVFLPQTPPDKTIVSSTSLEDSANTSGDFEMDTTTNHNNNTIKETNGDSGIFSSTDQSLVEPALQEDRSSEYSSCPEDDRKYFCPICNKMLSSQHEFTLHIRSHNNENDDQNDSEKSFICRICKKVLSSSSSLDRHVLVHSGERPFHCKFCGDTFTTNGNMHRHMRTHSNKSENYESDASIESSNSNKTEFNNNKIIRKRKFEESSDEESDVKKGLFECPVCLRKDFNSLRNLEAHLEDNHPEYPVKCAICKQVFGNSKQLDHHRETVHEASPLKEKQVPVMGFKDLTFVDFSSEKFPVIARRECELNLHKVQSGLKFQCRKCPRAFPCHSSLMGHEKTCLETSGNGLDLTKDNSPEKSDSKLRESLLACDQTKDLADIQSIITNLQPKLSRAQSLDLDSSLSKDQGEEETQDLFAVEFRKMKLRGEFPCRLCTAVFPNLRALKGHNRAHLNGHNNGTYHCNMCPHSSIDKAALIRHMRTHNGDRPYECALCNYAFTTKANCERHLRNRHAKSTREEVKKSIIYHPSEDPTNDDLNKLCEGKKLNLSCEDLREKLHSSTPKPESFKPLELEEEPRNNRILTPKIQVKSLEALQPNKYESEGEEDDYLDVESSSNKGEEPLDLVLDLSKKKDAPESKLQASPVLQIPTLQAPAPFSLFAQQFLKGGASPKIDAATFYASHLARLYAMPPWNFPLNPLLFPTLPLSPNPNELKERMRFQLSGGSFTSDEVCSSVTPPIAPQLPTKPELLKPLNIDSSYPQASPSKPDLQSPNSVKMVIKNGVLMPKQKQRRYRTERPFTCEHCSAKFTLRSNMERHIKQQHPQFWSQRQRGHVGNPGRKPSTKSFCDLNIPSYEEPSPAKECLNEKLKFAILAQQLRAQSLIKKEVEVHHITEPMEECDLVIDEPKEIVPKTILEEKLSAGHEKKGQEEQQDLVPVSRLLDNASQQPFKDYFKREGDEPEISEEDEEGLVASGSTSDGGTDENRSESETVPVKKKSAYSLAPNRVSCPYCSRKFPWTSSLRRHILTHTGQKPFKCSHCPLLFTTKSNCDRHLLRKHGNSATTMANEAPPPPSSVQPPNFLIRNVPERPFKCSNCPSSTFSTYSNLKKHISCKHSGDDLKAQGYEAGSSEDEKGCGVESLVVVKPEFDFKLANEQTVIVNSDLPFKCHLCEGSFGERQEALEHIRDRHCSEYDLLMSKNALDANAVTPDDTNAQEDEDNEIRGKFPDYSNRKVICAFCMRRFWSAEDLRRHMRTHTGERPFSCDICRRRFTLKHSMLRHRKKHNNFASSVDEAGQNSDEEVLGGNNGVKLEVKPRFLGRKSSEESDGAEGDLISNLLGLQDRSIIDKVLAASADDAAKLLGVGVKNGQAKE